VNEDGNKNKSLVILYKMAETKGFEPSNESPRYSLSREVVAS